MNTPEERQARRDFARLCSERIAACRHNAAELDDANHKEAAACLRASAEAWLALAESIQDGLDVFEIAKKRIKNTGWHV